MSGKKKYAEGTLTTVDYSKAEIERLLKKHGATSFGTLENPESSGLVCELGGRRLLFTIPKPKNDEAEFRRKWRVLVIRIKVRLEEIAGGDTTVDEAFMPYIFLPNGQTVGSVVIPGVRNAYLTGTMPILSLEHKQ